MRCVSAKGGSDYGAAGARCALPKAAAAGGGPLGRRGWKSASAKTYSNSGDPGTSQTTKIKETAAHVAVRMVDPHRQAGGLLKAGRGGPDGHLLHSSALMVCGTVLQTSYIRIITAHLYE